MAYLLAALALVAVLIAARLLLAREAILTLEDSLCLPGEEAEIRAWLERRLFLFIDPDIEGGEIELLSDAGPVGRAVTDLDGIARWRVGGLAPGLHRFRARLAGGARLRGADAEGLVAVHAADEPVLVTDIDRTVADSTPLGFITRPNESVRPMAGAPEALRELSAAMRVIYLSARDHIFVAKTRAWLRANGFPEGALFLRRLRFTSATPLEHKLARLGEITARFRNIRLGVGDLPSDVEAYRRHGIPPLLLSSRDVPGLAPGVPRAANWAEVLERVRGAESAPGATKS